MEAIVGTSEPPLPVVEARPDDVALTLARDAEGGFGLTLGGGAPHCPCIYATAIAGEAAASALECGDEILFVNDEALIGKTRDEVADLFRSAPQSVRIVFRKLDPEGSSKLKKRGALDLMLKRFKQRMADVVGNDTLNFLGIHRATLQGGDVEFAKKLDKFEQTRVIYTGLLQQSRQYVTSFSQLANSQAELGEIFADLSTQETDDPALKARLHEYGGSHRGFGKCLEQPLLQLQLLVDQLQTFLDKIIPDANLTIKKFNDAKHSYLAFCLKVHEMAIKEHQAEQKQEALSRLETGNYEFRFVLRDCLRARGVFDRVKEDLSVKLELLDSKHATDLCDQISRMTTSLAEYYEGCAGFVTHAEQNMQSVVDNSQERCSALRM